MTSPARPDAAGGPDPKCALRSRLRAARAGRPGAAPGLLALGLPRLSGHRLVTAYAAVPGEPDPAALVAALRAAGVVVLLPLVRPGHALAWGDGDLVPGPALPSGLRIPEPSCPSALGPADADVVLVPALAADSAGARLGQGGGYYDRALAGLPDGPDDGPLLVAVVHDDELLPAGTIPVEPHDRRVHAVLTPTRWLAVR